MRKNVLLAAGAVLLISTGHGFAADPEAGKKVFRKCVACHSLEPGKKKVGPSLHGIVGRKAAAMDGFNYSKVMRESGITWDMATLDAYLENPRQFLKGNRMSFPGLKNPNDRENVIAYIKESSK